MEKLTAKKKLSVLMSYFRGLSYDEIAAKSGVSKGTVANIIADLKAGNCPEAGDLADQIELLRDLSLDLRRLNFSPGQCAAGLIFLNRINECGLDPADIDRWPMILKSVPNQEDAEEFVRQVYSIQEVQKRTGLDLAALDDKIHEVERKTADLEFISNKVKDCKKELSGLTEQREKLVSAVTLLEQKNELLGPRVKDLEEREQTLSRRIADMEPKAEKAERTLSALKGETRKLEDIGFSLRDLTEFNEKLQEIAQDQAIKPSELRSRLLRELQTLDKGLTLETLIQSRQQELDKAEQAHVSAKKEVETTMAVVDSLGQEKTNLEESIKEMRNKVMREIAKIVPLARDAVVKFVEDLQHGNDEALAEVQRLKDEAIEIGREVGQYEGILKSCEWLDELLILVEGEENIADKRVKVIALLVVRAIHTWMKRQESISYALLQHALETLIGELDRWKV